MATYPMTPSGHGTASAADVLAALKAPTVLARRMADLLSAQEFLGNSLLTGRYAIEGGAILVPKPEDIRTERRAAEVAAGTEYQLTPLSGPEYDTYVASKRGIATEVTDELATRSRVQVIDDALNYLRTELLFDAEALALGTIASKVTNTIAAGDGWTTGPQVVKDVLRAKAQVRALRQGFTPDTVLLLEEHWAELAPDVLSMLPQNDTTVISGDFPTILGLTWITVTDERFTNPMLLDRRRLGGIARETIASPEYAAVGGDTGVEIASLREPHADKTRLQARNAHVPIVVNPAAGVWITDTAGTGT